MKLVKHVLSEKGSDTWTVNYNDTVYAALQLMADKGIGAVLVMDNGKLCGILSERDYARKVILKGESSKELKVKDIMTRDVLYVKPDNNMEECMATMTKKRARHLPVLEEGKLIGMISIGDVVKAVIEEKEYMIKQLENYIHGKI